MTVPLMFSIAIVTLGVIVVLEYLALGNRQAPAGTRPALIGLVAVVVVENFYYGIGRFDPEAYGGLSSHMPSVLAAKGGYIVALAYLALRLRPAKKCN